MTTVKHALSVSLYEGIIFLSYFKEKRIKKCQRKDVIQFKSYGRKVVEECKEGFNQEVKDKIYSFLQSHEKKRYPNKEQKQRLEFWQKFFENGHYERAGDPAEYDPSFHWNGTYR